MLVSEEQYQFRHRTDAKQKIGTAKGPRKTWKAGRGQNLMVCFQLLFAMFFSGFEPDCFCLLKRIYIYCFSHVWGQEGKLAPSPLPPADDPES